MVEYRYLQTETPTPGALQGAYDSLLRATAARNEASRTASRHFARITDRLLTAKERDLTMERQSQLRREEIRVEGEMRNAAITQQQFIRAAAEARSKMRATHASAWLDSVLGSQNSPMVEGGPMFSMIGDGMTEMEVRQALLARGRSEEEVEPLMKMLKQKTRYIPPENRSRLVQRAFQDYGPEGAEAVQGRLSKFPSTPLESYSRAMEGVVGPTSMLFGQGVQRTQDVPYGMTNPSASPDEWEKFQAAFEGKSKVGPQVVSEALLKGAGFDLASGLGTGYETMLQAFEDEGVQIVPIYSDDGRLEGYSLDATSGVVSPAALGKLSDMLKESPGAVMGALVSPSGIESPTTRRRLSEYLRSNPGGGPPQAQGGGGESPNQAPSRQSSIPESALDPFAPFSTPKPTGQSAAPVPAPKGKPTNIWEAMLGGEAMHYLNQSGG